MCSRRPFCILLASAHPRKNFSSPIFMHITAIFPGPRSSVLIFRNSELEYPTSSGIVSLVMSVSKLDLAAFRRSSASFFWIASPIALWLSTIKIRSNPRFFAYCSSSVFTYDGMSSIPCGDRDRIKTAVLSNSIPTVLALFTWTIAGFVHLEPCWIFELFCKLERYKSTWDFDGRLSEWSETLCMTIAEEFRFLYMRYVMLLPPIGWKGPGWTSGRTSLHSFFCVLKTIWNVETVNSSERASMMVSICTGSFLVDAATYAWSILWVLASLPVALSVISVHAVPSKRKVIP